MYKATILYGMPDDTEAFDRHYKKIHIPLAQRIRGLEHWTLTWNVKQEGEMTPPVYLIAELYAADLETMESILNSPEGKDAQADVANFASGGVTSLFGYVEEVEIK